MDNEILIQRLLKIKEIADDCLTALGQSQEQPIRPASKARESGARAQDIAVAIANKVGECQESDKLKKLLDKPTPEIKVLLCFYIATKYFDREWLTSGQIAKATAELGIKIDQGQASNKIKDLRACVESGSARKRGQPTPYRLNRLGLKRVEEMLNGQ